MKTKRCCSNVINKIVPNSASAKILDQRCPTQLTYSPEQFQKTIAGNFFEYSNSGKEHHKITITILPCLA
jgi:hypothetical protein